jgi:hypothetical protein
MENKKVNSFSLRFKELKNIKEELEKKNLIDNQIKDLLIKLLNYNEINSKDINVIKYFFIMIIIIIYLEFIYM